MGWRVLEIDEAPAGLRRNSQLLRGSPATICVAAAELHCAGCRAWEQRRELGLDFRSGAEGGEVSCELGGGPDSPEVPNQSSRNPPVTLSLGSGISGSPRSIPGDSGRPFWVSAVSLSPLKS